MRIPHRVDGQPLKSITFTHNAVYVDAHNYRDEEGRLRRMGPGAERHIHAFEEYGLVGLLRCKWCGRVTDVSSK